MQGYQRHIALQGGHCPGALNPRSVERLVAEWGNPLPYTHQPALGRGRPAVPVCPGHVRRLHPYPPSRRRRR